MHKLLHIQYYLCILITSFHAYLDTIMIALVPVPVSVGSHHSVADKKSSQMMSTEKSAHTPYRTILCTVQQKCDTTHEIAATCRNCPPQPLE